MESFSSIHEYGIQFSIHCQSERPDGSRWRKPIGWNGWHGAARQTVTDLEHKTLCISFDFFLFLPLLLLTKNENEQRKREELKCSFSVSVGHQQITRTTSTISRCIYTPFAEWHTHTQTHTHSRTDFEIGQVRSDCAQCIDACEKQFLFTKITWNRVRLSILMLLSLCEFVQSRELRFRRRWLYWNDA